MSRSLARLAFIAVTAAATFLTACDNPVDVTPNAFDYAREDGPPVDATSTDGPGAGAADGAEAGATEPCGCLQVGQVYRFDSLNLTALDGGPHPAVPQLNNRWTKDIASRELNALFIIAAVGGGERGEDVEIRAVNAAQVPGEMHGPDAAICELPATEIRFHLQRAGCTLTMTEATSIFIYAGTADVPKNCAPSLPVPDTIPVRQVRLQFDVTPGCTGLEKGEVLEGSVAKSDLGSVCTCLGNDADLCAGPTAAPGCGGCPGAYSNLETLVKAVNGGREPEYNCQTETGGPAVCLEATFTAERLQTLPATCPGAARSLSW